MSCVGCHAEQVEPLSKSRHGHASSPGLWGQLPESGPHLGAGPACLLCHAPAADQQPWKSAAAPPADAGPGRTAIEAASLALASAPATPNPTHDPHATALGVSCTACHVQGGRIVGTRADPRAPHPVDVDPSLASPTLCARCHQFGSDGAVNGKPVENTFAEWKESSWGRAGATCQSCHLPAGKHLFQGIHTPSLVGASVQVTWNIRPERTGELSIANSAVGHYFPTYATPRVVLSVQPEDGRGSPVGPAAREVLGRELRFQGGRWEELSDTRIPPGKTHSLRHPAPPAGARRLHATVRIEPDFAYLALYRELLAGSGLTANQRTQLETELHRAEQSGFTIFDELRNL